MMTDPVGDMLTRIRNAGRARHARTSCPASRLKLAVARVLSAVGFVGEVSTETQSGHPNMTIGIRYDDEGKMIVDGIRRVSKPGRRVYANKSRIPPVLSGLGITILTTSHGVMTGHRCRAEGVGGEVVCKIW